MSYNLLENLLELAEGRKWRKIYCWEPELHDILTRFEFPYFETGKDFEQAEVGFTVVRSFNSP